jgi:cytochrome c2
VEIIAGFRFAAQLFDRPRNASKSGRSLRKQARLRSPQAKIPGTKMVFAGLGNPQEIDVLWAYIKQFGP